jgi:uncharacterized protein
VYKTAIAAPSGARCMVDLAWLLQSPPLLNLAPHRFSAAVQAFDAADADRITQWLRTTDISALHSYVAQALPSKAPMRLGRYAERLMEYFLRESDLFELVAANIPLRTLAGEGKAKTHTTVGEFDYLIKDTNDVSWHWEMAVKFYVYHPAGLTAEAHDFKGPAGKDTLALKLSKVFEKQLKHCPPPPYEKTVWQPAAYARGWMFYPYGSHASLRDALNPQHLRGWWLSIQGFENTLFESTHFVHLPRLHWLAPYALNELTVMSQVEASRFLQNYWLTADAKQTSAGQMIACVVFDGECWRERSRGFVLPMDC